MAVVYIECMSINANQTMLVVVLLGLLFVAFLMGRDVDIEPINIELCMDVARPSRKTPHWVKKELFERVEYPVVFYDWKKLDSSEWEKLHSAINVLQNDRRMRSPCAKNVHDLVYAMASVYTSDAAEFEAAVQTLQLMIVDMHMLVDFNRVEAFHRATALQMKRRRESIQAC